MKKPNLDSQIDNLNKEIEKIKTRNHKVELEKAWETSLTRKVWIAIFTYLTIGIFMSAIKINKPWLNAIVPSIGFILSTLSLPIIKKQWMREKYGD